MAKKLRRPFPQFNPFRPFVIDELTRRSTSTVNSHVPTNLPFVRFTSLVQSSKYTFFTLGMHGYKNEAKDMFELGYGNRRDVVGYGYAGGEQVLVYSDDLKRGNNSELVKSADGKYKKAIDQEEARKEQQQKIIFAAGAHPTPGITNISVRRQGLGTPLITTVNFVCFNRSQMEFLRAHFMTAGLHVVVEWGQNFSDLTVNNTLNFGSVGDITQAYRDSVIKGRSNMLDVYAEPNHGNYDFTFGVVSNFGVKYNARTGVYECTSTVVSSGEQFRGIANFITYVEKVNDYGEVPTSIAEYFRFGQGFDRSVARMAAAQPEYATHTAAEWARKAPPAIAPGDIKNLSTNPDDYAFVSWKGFVKVIIPELFDMVKSDRARESLKSLLDFAVDDTGPMETQNWVGDNFWLRSTSPDVMVLIRSNSRGVPADLLNAGYFNDWPGAGDVRGKLSKGVWLNSGMIRRSFLNNQTVDGAIKSILTEMNNATDNFWALTLFYDDETAKYKIVDMKCTDPQYANEFYTFNKSNESECTDIDLDSAFPPEMVTQMMLYGYYKSANGATRADLLKKLPSIGMPNTFMFSMNWTDLTDVIITDLTNNPISPNNGQAADTKVLQLETVLNTNKARLVPVAGSANSVASAATTNRGVPNKPLGSNTLHQPGATVTDAVTVKRNSVKNTMGSKVVALNDPRMNPKLAKNFTAMKKELERKGFTVETTSTFRTADDQERLRKLGYPTAKKSNHLTGNALDVLIYPSGKNDLTNDQKKRYTTEHLDELTSAAENNGLETLKDTSFQDVDPYHVQLQKADRDTFDGRSPSEKAREASLIPPGQFDGGEQGSVEERENTQLATEESEKKVQDDIRTRFGDNFVGLIAPSPSRMTSLITKRGYANPKLPNGHVIGFPTTTSITVTLPGISGISVSDGFMVDRIPFVFEQYGLFQTVEISEDISVNGWFTKVRGIFKLIRLEEGPKPV
jgi:uncharacterized protein YcbK (DUF882 family)